MRDTRFIAEHRGGPLPLEHHRMLMLWSADCVEHVLLHSSAVSIDVRPLKALEIARQWARGEIKTGVAQKAAVAAHRCAREIIAKTPDQIAAIAIARAAGHAVATAHFAEHSLGGANYAIKAVAAQGHSKHDERNWQLRQLPDEILQLVTSALNGERFASVMRDGKVRRRTQKQQ